MSRYLIGAVIGALLLYALLPEPAVPEPFQIVHVSPQQLDAVEPDAERGLLERVATRRVEPAQVAIAQDSSRAAEFVRLYVGHSVQPDTSRLALPVRSEIALLGYAGRQANGTLELYSVGTDRSRQRHTFEAGCAPMEWLYDGGEIYVQAGRWCWLDDVLLVSGVAAAAYGVGAGQLEFTLGGAAVLAVRKAVF